MSWQENSWARKFSQALLNPFSCPEIFLPKNNAMVFFDAAQMPASSPITA
jgi:hypothetical protein